MIDPITVLRKELRTTTSAAFAARMGVSAAYISHVISGRRPPSEKMLAALGLRRVVRVTYERVRVN